jgi:hypothetical protein
MPPFDLYCSITFIILLGLAMMESMSEIPSIHAAEIGPERIHTKEEILAVLSKWCENLDTIQTKEDADGIYELRMDSPEIAPGEFNRYIYSRKGIFGKDQAVKTTIEVVYYLNNEPVGGDSLVNYNATADTWE